MLKEYMWNLFQNTGDVKSYILYKEMVEKEKSESEENITIEQVASTHMI